MWNGPYVITVIAFVVAVIIAGVARFGGAGRVGLAFAGLAGPAMGRRSYVIVMPATQQAQSGHVAAYRAALFALGAGLLGSAVVALPGRAKRRPERRAEPAVPTRSEVSYRRRPDDDTDMLAVPARPAKPAIMGQPRGYEEDYSDWLRELGPGTQQGTVYGGGSSGSSNGNQ